MRRGERERERGGEGEGEGGVGAREREVRRMNTKYEDKSPVCTPRYFFDSTR